MTWHGCPRQELRLEPLQGKLHHSVLSFLIRSVTPVALKRDALRSTGRNISRLLAMKYFLSPRAKSYIMNGVIHDAFLLSCVPQE